MTITAITPADFPWFRYDGYTFSLGLTDGTTAWLSGHSASQYDAELRRIVVRGDMREQAATAYDKIRAILGSAGLGFGDVTRLVENVTAAGLDSYYEAADVRERVLGGHQPTVVTVAVDRLLRPDALIEIEVGATRGGGQRPGSGPDRLAGGITEGSDGLLYLPTVLPVDDDGQLVAAGDAGAQYAHCVARVERALRAVGVSLEHLARASVTVPVGTGLPTMSGLGPLASGTVTVQRLRMPGALVALDGVAARTPPVEVARGLAADGGCAAVRMGRTVLVSQATAPGAGDVVAEATEVYRWLAEVLAAAGGGPEHLVKTIEYVVEEGLAAYRGVGQVRGQLLRAPWPASTGAVCTAVGRGGALLAVDATAVIPDGAAH